MSFKNENKRTIISHGHKRIHWNRLLPQETRKEFPAAKGKMIPGKSTEVKERINSTRKGKFGEIKKTLTVESNENDNISWSL